jgi:hypothetical protein
MPSAHDDRDRKEATQLLLAAAVALILLVAIVWGGLYYLFETANFSDPFAAGLGLKNAALISFGVSLASWPSRRAVTPSSASCRSPSQGS